MTKDNVLNGVWNMDDDVFMRIRRNVFKECESRLFFGEFL